MTRHSENVPFDVDLCNGMPTIRSEPAAAHLHGLRVSRQVDRPEGELLPDRSLLISESSTLGSLARADVLDHDLGSRYALSTTMGKGGAAGVFALGALTGAAAAFVVKGGKRLRPAIPINNLSDDAEIFARRHAGSLDAVEKLHATTLDLLRSPMKREGSEDNTLYLLAAACLHEFNEVTLLAVHMYGTGALKLVRPLYERVVTLSYLAKNPGEVQQFIDYSDVHWNKLLEEAKRIFGDNVLPSILSKKEADTIAANYQKNRGNFQQTDCKKCGTTRLQGSWTKKSTPELAGDVSKELRSLYVKAFQAPTLHIHTTFWGIVDQLKPTPNGKVGFSQEHEQESAREAMDIGHTLMLQVLDVVNTYFKLGKDDVVKQRAAEWAQAWREGTPAGYLPNL